MAASTATLVMCQMPRECFFVMEMHGIGWQEEDEDTLLTSDLPKLMSFATPDTRIQSVLAQQVQDGDGISIQMRVGSDETDAFDLGQIGSEEAFAEDARPISLGDAFDGISILTDEMNGVCNVVVHQGDNGTLPLFNMCYEGDEDVRQISYYLPKETPLVGLHGLVTEESIMSLGLILLDTMDPACQKQLETSKIGNLDTISKALLDFRVEDEISFNEQERAKILEAILQTDSLYESRYDNQDAIHTKIEELSKSKPVVLAKEEIDSDLFEIIDFLEDKEEDYEAGVPITMGELHELFKNLLSYYEEEGSA